MTRQGVPMFAALPLSDWLQCLQQGSRLHALLGQWVSLNVSGRYRGDTGFVIDEDDNGKLHILVVPRLLETNDVLLGKRSRKVAPAQDLYFPATHNHLGPPCIIDEHRLKCQRWYFEHGLLLLQVSPNVVSLPLRIQSSSIEYFRGSGHPFIDFSSLPTPSDWVFHSGDRVSARYDVDDVKVALEGTVLSVNETKAMAEVQLDGGEDCHNLQWRDICKVFSLGEWVDCLGGPNCGKTGLVSAVEEELITVLRHEDGEVMTLFIHRLAPLADWFSIDVSGACEFAAARTQADGPFPASRCDERSA